MTKHYVVNREKIIKHDRRIANALSVEQVRTLLTNKQGIGVWDGEKSCTVGPKRAAEIWIAQGCKVWEAVELSSLPEKCSLCSKRIAPADMVRGQMCPNCISKMFKNLLDNIPVV